MLSFPSHLHTSNGVWCEIDYILYHIFTHNITSKYQHQENFYKKKIVSTDLDIIKTLTVLQGVRLDMSDPNDCIEFILTFSAVITPHQSH